MKNIINIADALLLIFQIVIGFNITAKGRDIPIHWGFDGGIDAWGSPYLIFILPAAAIVVWLICRFYEKHPQFCNYPYSVRDRKAAFAVVEQMMGCITLWTSAFTAFLCYCVYDETLYMVPFIILLLVMVLILIYYSVRLYHK